MKKNTIVFVSIVLTILLILYVLADTNIFYLHFNTIVNPATKYRYKFDFSNERYNENKVGDAIITVKFQPEFHFRGKYSLYVNAITKNSQYNKLIVRGYHLNKNRKKIIAEKSFKEIGLFKTQKNRNYFRAAVIIFNNKLFAVSFFDDLELILNVEIITKDNKTIAKEITLPLDVDLVKFFLW